MLLLEQFHNLTLNPANAARLKELVLQLAVQGKLTEAWRNENPDVEPASELLKKIEAEKTESIKVKRTKDIAFAPIIEDELTVDLPEKWAFCRLGEIIRISSGDGLTSKEMTEGGLFPVYGGNGINGYHDKYNVKERTIVIGRVGFYCGSIHLSEEKAWVTDNAFITYYSKNNIDRDFLIWLLKATNLKENENATAQPVISGRKLYPIIIALPPLAEQEAIVTRVEELFKNIEALQEKTIARIKLKKQLGTAALQNLTTATPEDLSQNWQFLKENFGTIFEEAANVKKLRETILQLAVQGKLTQAWRHQNPNTEPASELLKRIQAEKRQLVQGKKIKKEQPLPSISEDEIPFEIPNNWVWCRLEDLAHINSGVTKGKTYKGEIVDVPYLRVANVQRGYLDLSIMKNILVSKEDYNQYQLELYDLLMIEGGDPDKLGRCAIWQNEISGCIYQNHVFRVRAIKKTEIDEYFLMLFINSPFSRVYYENCAKRTTNLASINKTQMRNTPIALPPYPEQKAIVTKVDELMQLCDELEKQIEQSKQETEALMQAVVQEALQIKEEIFI